MLGGVVVLYVQDSQELSALSHEPLKQLAIAVHQLGGWRLPCGGHSGIFQVPREYVDCMDFPVDILEQLGWRLGIWLGLGGSGDHNLAVMIEFPHLKK